MGFPFARTRQCYCTFPRDRNSAAVTSCWLSLSLSPLLLSTCCSKCFVTYMFLPCCSLSEGLDAASDCTWLAVDSLVSFSLSSTDLHTPKLSLRILWLLPLSAVEPRPLLLFREPNTGTIRTTKGLRAGKDAHTIARFASMALQYAVGALWYVASS